MKENIENENKSFMDNLMKCDIYIQTTNWSSSKKTQLNLMKILSFIRFKKSNHIYDETKSSSY